MKHTGDWTYMIDVRRRSSSCTARATQRFCEGLVLNSIKSWRENPQVNFQTKIFSILFAVYGCSLIYIASETCILIDILLLYIIGNIEPMSVRSFVSINKYERNHPLSACFGGYMVRSDIQVRYRYY